MFKDRSNYDLRTNDRGIFGMVGEVCIPRLSKGWSYKNLLHCEWAMITELKDNQLFVFGSNMAGDHAGGAARQAHEQFGAETGIGEGLTGQTYAFPTLQRDRRKRGIVAMQYSRDRLYATARALPEKEFLLTPVGTGIAGFTYSEIEPLFSDLPENIKKVGWAAKYSVR